MQLNRLTIGLLSLCSLWIIESLFSFSATAQCIQADIGVQYNISGSIEPTERINDVDFQSHGVCRSNVSVTTGVQGNEGGTGRVRQSRIVRHRFENQNTSVNDSGSSPIQIKSNPTIDVYNAAENLRSR